MTALKQLPTAPLLPPPPAEPGPAEEAQASGGMSIAQALAIVRAHWRVSLIIWLCVTCLAGVGIKFLPKTYVATATIIVDTGAKDPLAGQEFPVALLQSYVATQTELIQSQNVLLGVVERLNLTQDPEFAHGFRGTGVDNLKDYVQRNVAAALQVDQGRGGQLIYISVAAKEADKAAAIANAVGQVYLEQQRRRINEPAGARAQRYSEQLGELRAKVAAAQEMVAQFRQQHGITDVETTTNNDPDNVDTETQALNSLEEHLLEAQNQRRALEAKLSGGGASQDDIQASQPVQHLQEQLSTLQAQLSQLGAVYGAHHPKVLEVQSQLAAVQKQLDEQVHQLGASATIPLERAKALEQKYSRAVDEQRAKVLQLREVQGQGAKLMLELESAQSVYKRALDGYDQIMFASADNYTNVGLVSKATPPVSPTKPKKLKLFAMALIGALGLGLAVPFARELFLDRRLRCPDDIERGFGIPVLAQLKAFPTPTSAA